MTDLEASIQGEQIIWQGKPQFKCFLLEAIFNPMLVFSLIWAAFDIGAIYVFTSDNLLDAFGFVGTLGLIVFFLIHMMPVWIYLSGVLFCYLRYKHTEYVITEKGIYVSGGLFSVKVKSSSFEDITQITIHRGYFDNKLDVGDINMIKTTLYNNPNSPVPRKVLMSINICDIEDYQQVLGIIKSMKSDIYSDSKSPNSNMSQGYSSDYEKDW